MTAKCRRTCSGSGRGTLIAFNILNIGRFKLGAMCVVETASAENAISYAKQRKAFNKVIAALDWYGKIANMATLLFVGESWPSPSW